jgi:hypothetical protein
MVFLPIGEGIISQPQDNLDEFIWVSKQQGPLNRITLFLFGDWVDTIIEHLPVQVRVYTDTAFVSFD